jgi:Cys-rich repeat protein
MICGYNNIYDLCINKYTYQYINGSGSINDPVLRIDKIDDSRSYISPINTDVIVPCDYNDEIEAVTSWDCYQIYKNFSLSVSNNSLQQQKNNQTSTVSNFNNSTLNAGIDISISNNNTITLKTTKEDQIHIGNIVAYANLLYEQNINSKMPPILDINSNAYNLNYQQLFKVCSEYLNTIILYHYINKDLNNSLSNSTTSDEIANCNYCDTKQPKSFDVPTIPLNDLVDNDKNLDINLEIQRCFNNSDCPSGYVCKNGICVVQRGCCVCNYGAMSWDCSSASLCTGRFVSADIANNNCGCELYTTIGSGPCSSLDPTLLAGATAVCQNLGGYIYYDPEYSC